MLSIINNVHIYNRLIAQLPPWYGTDHSVLDAVLQGYVATAGFNYRQLMYDLVQMRLQTAIGDNLDLISQDYFGGALPRRDDEDDYSFRTRISANLLQERATRRGMENALYILTGYYPTIFEPWKPSDCGGYNVANAPQTIGYGTHGSYGSSSYAYQCFIDVYVDGYYGMASRAGYNTDYMGYNAAGAPAIGWYGGVSEMKTIITDADIYQTINFTKVHGTVCWVAIHRLQ